MECLLCARYRVSTLHTYIHTYSLFQMCEVGDYHHFTEVAGKTKRNQVTWLWSHGVVALCCSTIRPPNFIRWLQKSSFLGHVQLLWAQPIFSSWLHVSCSGVDWKELLPRPRGIDCCRGQSQILQEDMLWQNKPRTQPQVRGTGTFTSPTGKHGMAGAGSGQIVIVESILSKRWAQHRSLIL